MELTDKTLEKNRLERDKHRQLRNWQNAVGNQKSYERAVSDANVNWVAINTYAMLTSFCSAKEAGKELKQGIGLTEKDKRVMSYYHKKSVVRMEENL